jgi:hypothetical protein
MWSILHHGCFTSGIEQRGPLNRKLARPKRESGYFEKEENLLPLLRNEPQIVWPVA